MNTLGSLLDNPTLFCSGRFLLVGRQRLTKRLLQEHLKTGPDETVLDVCCGIGEFSEGIEAAYVGVDLNPKFIDYARRKYRHVRTKTFEVGNATSLRFAEKYFDKAIVINALHHFSDDEATRLLSEIRRVTRRLVIIVDADGAPKGLLRRMLVAIDRGKFMRNLEGLSLVISNVFKIEKIVRFDVGFYTEFLVRCPIDATAGLFCYPAATRPQDRV